MWLCSYTQRLYCSCFLISLHACLVHPRQPYLVRSLKSCVSPSNLVFSPYLVRQSSIFFFANSLVVLFSCLAVDRHWPDKMRASFLLLLGVVLLATAAFANESVSTCRVTHTWCMAKLLYFETVQLRSINTIQSNTV